MPATKPRRIQLVSVDGTKTHDELMRQLLRALKDAGTPVRLTSEERIKYGLDQPDAT